MKYMHALMQDVTYKLAYEVGEEMIRDNGFSSNDWPHAAAKLWAGILFDGSNRKSIFGYQIEKDDF